MKRFIIYILLYFLIFSCEKDEINLPGKSYIKTRYNYSSSTDSEPYSFTSYFYDDKWNLIKELIFDYPKPVWASYTYEYSDDGKLLNKKFKGKEGNNYPSQTESEFILIREYKYQYIDNKKIEKEYNRNNELTDSAIFIYRDDFLMAEYHYDLIISSELSTIYEYDSNNNLIKRTSNPDGTYTIYYYEGLKIHKTLNYNQDGSLLVENLFIYTQSDNREIVEVLYKGPYGEYISDKSTYKDGKIIEYIKYHPTFIGAEWYCERYDYY